MKLGDASIHIKISEVGTYTVLIHAADCRSSDSLKWTIENRRFKFELPVGPRPIMEDVETILRMVVEEMAR